MHPNTANGPVQDNNQYGSIAAPAEEERLDRGGLLMENGDCIGI
jgi:hypothetical protein